MATLTIVLAIHWLRVILVAVLSAVYMFVWLSHDVMC